MNRNTYPLLEGWIKGRSSLVASAIAAQQINGRDNRSQESDRLHWVLDRVAQGGHFPPFGHPLFPEDPPPGRDPDPRVQETVERATKVLGGRPGQEPVALWAVTLLNFATVWRS
jgi:hypothetical protein